jgi:hypothetical protein
VTAAAAIADRAVKAAAADAAATATAARVLKVGAAKVAVTVAPGASAPRVATEKKAQPPSSPQHF